MHEILNFDVFQFILFSLCYLCFWYHIQENIAKSNVIELSLYVFLCKSFIVLCHGLFCIWCKIRVQLFGLWISSFSSIICWKACSSPTEWSWHPGQRPFDSISEGLFLGCLLFHWSICLSHCFDYYRFVVSFEIKKGETFTFILILKNCFVYLMSLKISYEFKIDFSISVKKKTTFGGFW